MIKFRALTAVGLSLALTACQPATTDATHKTISTSERLTMTPTDSAALEPHLYLEEVLGEEALDKVKGWNARSLERLQKDPLFETLESEALEILNSKDKIPYVSYRAGKVNNFWQDTDSVRGVWRRADLKSYLSAFSER